MIPELRAEFNRKFSKEKYDNVRSTLEHRSGTPIEFRVAETPLFLPKAFAKRAATLAEEILIRAASAELQQIGKLSIPSEWNYAGETEKPLFAAVDFAITGTNEKPELKLIELQAFPSLFYYQRAFSDAMRDEYGLAKEMNGLFDPSFGEENYDDVLSKAILGSHEPKDVALLDIDPHHQKTRPDFYLASKKLGIHVVDIADVIAQGNELFHPDPEGHLHRITRIYNRAIVDELVRRNIHLKFDIHAEYDVEWAGHPNWFFRISKALLPHLVGTNEAVPSAHYLSNVDVKSVDLASYVLKPLFSFAGVGVNISPAMADIQAIAENDRGNWLLQEKVKYADVIITPDGSGVRAELRAMIVWLPEWSAPKALHTLVRLTRGQMIGVDQNKGLDWVGSSCALIA
jgi:hypothetical protein